MTTKLNIAIAFYGQPRYLDNLTSYYTHRDKIFNQDINYDIFTHYWFDSKIETFTVSDRTKPFPNYCLEDSPLRIEQLYSPIRKIEEKPREFKFIEYDDLKEFCSPMRFYSENQFYNMLSQIYSFEKSVELISEYSKQTGIKYDFVVSTRYDNNILNFPNFYQVQKNKIYSVGRYNPVSFVDALMIIDANYIDYKPYSNFREAIKKVPFFATDEVKKAAFIMKYDLKHITHHHELDVGLLRSREDTYGQV